MRRVRERKRREGKGGRRGKRKGRRKTGWVGKVLQIRVLSMGEGRKKVIPPEHILRRRKCSGSVVQSPMKLRQRDCNFKETEQQRVQSQPG